MTINLVDSPSSSGTDYWFRPTHLVLGLVSAVGIGAAVTVFDTVSSAPVVAADGDTGYLSDW
jgi:hypothetical protein